MNIENHRISFLVTIISLVLCGCFFVLSFFALLNKMVSYKYQILQNIYNEEYVSLEILEQELKMSMNFDVFALIFATLTFLFELFLLFTIFNKSSK